MPTINTYLTFKGNCEEAFKFYKSVFGGKFNYIGKFKDMPENPSTPWSDADNDKIMHVSLPISKETILMGCDIVGEAEEKFNPGNNFSISLNTENQKEADVLFNALSKNGSVNLPMNHTFWGSYFGMLTDRFGIHWMVSFNETGDTK